VGGGALDLPMSVRPSDQPPKKFVSRVSLVPFVPHTCNFSDTLFRMLTCAPGYFHPSIFNIDGVVGLILWKYAVFSLCRTYLWNCLHYKLETLL